jgi:hypothetical protein
MLASAGIVIVLVVFLLIRREDLRDRFIGLIGKGQVNVTIQMLEDAGDRGLRDAERGRRGFRSRSCGRSVRAS